MAKYEDGVMYYFIINPASQSGRGYKIWEKIEPRLVRDGVEYQAYLTEYAGQATEYARKLTSHCKEARVIVVVGGDGTMNEVVDGIVSCDMVTLGYIPVGTGSDLARGLRLSRRPMRGLRRIFRARRIRQIDYGVIAYGDDVLRHRRFIVSAGIGLDAEVCQHMQRSAIKNICNRIHLRRLSYRILGFIQYLKEKPIRGYILLDGTRRVEFNYIYFISAQIQPCEGGGFWFAPKADSSDGNLEVCIVSHASKRQVLGTLLRALFQRSHNRGLRCFSCREVQIYTERPMAVHVDGESCQYQSNLEVRCIERKLKIVG